MTQLLGAQPHTSADSFTPRLHLQLLGAQPHSSAGLSPLGLHEQVAAAPYVQQGLGVAKQGIELAAPVVSGTIKQVHDFESCSYL